MKNQYLQYLYISTCSVKWILAQFYNYGIISNPREVVILREEGGSEGGIVVMSILR